MTSGKLVTIVIVTTTPSELTTTVDNRMSVILGREDEAGWFDPGVMDSVKVYGDVADVPGAQVGSGAGLQLKNRRSSASFSPGLVGSN